MLSKAMCLLMLVLITPLAIADSAAAVRQAVLEPRLRIAVFADGIEQARSLDVADDGTVAVGTASNAVFLLRDEDGDGIAELTVTINKLDHPTGVAWRGADLYIAERQNILQFINVRDNLENNAKPELQIVASGFHSSSHHGRRVIDFGPDGKLYVALGEPCNICVPKDPEFGALIRQYDLEAKTSSGYAFGLRNSVGFDWHSTTDVLWATDSGSDWLGDDLPSDELNRIAAAGLHFGFPYCHQGDLPDSNYGSLRGCAEFEPPAVKLGAHVSSLGLHITPVDAPIAANSALIALHGSWNRSEPVGYAVAKIDFDADGEPVGGVQEFIGGWLRDGEYVARPVDIASLLDGSLLVSDDFNGTVYRISKIDGSVY